MGRNGEKGPCLHVWVFGGLKGVYPVMVSGRRKSPWLLPRALVGGPSEGVLGAGVSFCPIQTLLILSQSGLGLATVVGVSDS